LKSISFESIRLTENLISKGAQAKSGKSGKGRSSMKSRLGGFATNGNKDFVSWSIDATPSLYSEEDLAKATVTGTCLDLEKRYLRLTTVYYLF